ncbi:6186_t:CDS:2 [Ambispora gerdemannii]|uniref:6186_t:CDS:1 n=1 Tax=Ambispora gerdemannii TaxID=144530 RepID=A0A9N9BFL8_9GLOM|nr:6186_t:CDS:2 [Ambispora gerdemannii]
MSKNDDLSEILVQQVDLPPPQPGARSLSHGFSFKTAANSDKIESDFDSKSGTIIKTEISEVGKSVITLKKEIEENPDSTSIPKESKIYIGYHRIEKKSSESNNQTTNSIHYDLGFFETNADFNFNWSVAVIDSSEEICWIAFSFYKFSILEHKPDKKLGIYKLNHEAGSHYSYTLFEKSVFLLVYHHPSRSVRPIHVTGTGNGIIKFLNNEELVILRRNNFRIMRCNSAIHFNTGFANSFWSTVALFNIGKVRRKKRINTDHNYPLPMNKFAKNLKYTENVVEHKLNNFVKDHYLYSINRNNKIERYDLTTGELDRLFNINKILAKSPEKKPDDTTDKESQGDSNSQTEQKSEKQNDDKIKHTVVLPVFAVSNNEEKQQYLAASLGSNSFTVYFMPNSIELVTHELPDDNAKIRFMAFISNNTKLLIVFEKSPSSVVGQGQDIEKEIWIWNMPGTLNFEEHCETVELEKIAKDHHLELTEINLENASLKSYYKLEYEETYNEKCKIKDLEFFVKKNSIFYKKDGLIKLFYQNPDDNKQNPEDNHQKTEKNVSQPLEDNVGEKESIINNDGNGDEKKIDEIKIEIEGEKIVKISKRDGKEYALINIWSIPTAFSKYVTDPIISKYEFVEVDQSVKITLKSRANQKESGFQHNIAINPQATSIVGMCSALKLIIKQKEEDYKKNSESPKKAETPDKYEQLFRSIKKVASNIIEEAIKNQDNFRMLDARFRIVATIIRVNFQKQLECILAKPEDRLHIPRQNVQDKTNTSFKFNSVFLLPKAPIDDEHPTALLIAIKQNQHDTVEKLLDYYSTLAVDNPNWMDTVTKVLPELITKFPKNVIQLMNSDVFHSKEIPLDQSWEFYRPNNDLNRVYSFHAEFNLFDTYRQQEYEKLTSEKKNQISRYRKTNMKYCQVPLPGLMTSDVTSTSKRIWKAVVDNTCDFFLNLVLLERNHGDESPFTKLIIHDKTGEIYDNPSIEAVVDFQWRHYARVFVIIGFLLYIAYAIVFIWLSYRHLSKLVYSQPIGPLFIPAASIMCGFAYILLTGKIKGGRYLANQQLLPIVLYTFDLAGSTIPLIGCAMMISVNLHYDGLLEVSESRVESNYCHEHPRQCKSQVIFYALSGLLLWIVFSSTFNGSFITENPDGTTQPLVNNATYPNFTFHQIVDWNDRTDNYYYFWDKSVEAVYFWISGRWDQVTNWNFWPVDVVTVIASIFLATLLQNLLISLMGNALGESTLEKRAVIQMRAQLLINYTDAFAQHRNVYYAIPTDEWKNLRKTIKESNRLDTYEEQLDEKLKRIESHLTKIETNDTNEEQLREKLKRDTYEELEEKLKRIESQLEKIETRHNDTSASTNADLSARFDKLEKKLDDLFKR